MKTSYIQYVVECKEGNEEIVMAYLSELPINSIWEDDHIMFYISQTVKNSEFEQDLLALSEHLNFSYRSVELEDKNWNEEWESGFEPVEVGRFCRIRALFHEPSSAFEHEIVIQPKMAFGTGHHATTYMMIERMQDINFNAMPVWDYGSGTGILSILASKLGASRIVANEIETIAVENALENAQLNATPNIQFLEGDLTVLPDQKYDVILANINRTVLINSMEDMKQRLSDGGLLIMSGILEADKELVSEAIVKSGLRINMINQREDWLMIEAEKPF